MRASAARLDRVLYPRRLEDEGPVTHGLLRRPRRTSS